MPNELGPPFEISFQRIPPHMSTEDYTLWVRYAPTIPAAALRAYFDVRLGGDHALGVTDDEPLQRGWWQLNAKRADVLIEYPDHLDMLELRTNAQPNAIGRLLTYRMLWDDAPPIAKPLTQTLVTDRDDPDVRRLAQLQRIAYVVIPSNV